MEDIKQLKEVLKNKEYELKNINTERIKLQCSIEHIQKTLAENKITQQRDEQWDTSTYLSLKNKKRKLKKLNIKGEELKGEIGKLRKEIRIIESSRLDRTFERLFILNAKSILDRELYEKIRDMTLEDLKNITN